MVRELGIGIVEFALPDRVFSSGEESSVKD
jgi:hypothetical protein